MDQPIYYNIDDIKNDGDSELLRKLKLAWGYDVGSKSLTVIGKIKKIIPREGAFFFLFTELKSSTDFSGIQYPLNLDRSFTTVDNIYIQHNQAESMYRMIDDSHWVIAKVGLSEKRERQKKGNPFALMVTGTVDVLTELPEDGVNIYYKNDGDSMYVKRTVVDFYIAQNRDDIESAKKLDSERAEKEYQELQKSIDSDLSNLKDNINDLTDDKKKLVSDVASKSTAKHTLESKIVLLSQSVNDRKLELDVIEQDYSIRKKKMESNLSRLHDFIKTKADKLSKLELVSANDLSMLVGNPEQQDKEFAHLSFKDHFSGDFVRAASYIQSFLHKRGIYYKQGLLKDFFAMLRTNDLIILAGDSGSGKTNLVKSMADAIGGKSIIIPVKPNWTSSEDLLGYYNPLEKKYLSAPFLDALIEASQHPEIPYLICLDEMNLARVEYYFADFLSKMEERSELPDIYLYSDAEADHTLSEFKTFLSLIDDVKSLTGKENIEDFLGLLKDEEVNQAINKICGFNSGDSLLKYHSHLRQILSGFLNTPSSIKFPGNVRVIGSINVDETTHYLSPKILDRAHVIRFSSPLLYDWASIDDEIETFDSVVDPLLFDISDLGVRDQYPDFDRDDNLAKLIIDITEKFLNKLGIEIGFRTVRQALNYRKELKLFESDDNIILNNFILHKILPKLFFDGEQASGDVQKKNILEAFRNHLAEILSGLDESPSIEYCVDDLDRVIENAKANNWVVNYWSK